MTTAALATLVPLLSCDDVMSPELELAAAESAVEGWVERHPDGWSLDLHTNQPPTRPQWSKPCQDHPESGLTTLRYAADDAEIELNFRCPVVVDAGAEELAGRFEFAVLKHLPHGIRSPGWRFRVLLGSGAVYDPVRLSSSSPGRLRVGIETSLWAVGGYSTRASCRGWVDGPSPEGCYLVREHRVPLDFSLEGPLPASTEG